MLALIVGIVVVVLGVLGVVRWFPSFKIMLEGVVPALLICGGLLAVIAGVTSIKDAMEAKKLEQENKEGEKK